MLELIYSGGVSCYRMEDVIKKLTFRCYISKLRKDLQKFRNGLGGRYSLSESGDVCISKYDYDEMVDKDAAGLKLYNELDKFKRFVICSRCKDDKIWDHFCKHGDLESLYDGIMEGYLEHIDKHGIVTLYQYLNDETTDRYNGDIRFQPTASYMFKVYVIDVIVNDCVLENIEDVFVVNDDIYLTDRVSYLMEGHMSKTGSIPDIEDMIDICRFVRSPRRDVLDGVLDLAYKRGVPAARFGKYLNGNITAAQLLFLVMHSFSDEYLENALRMISEWEALLGAGWCPESSNAYGDGLKCLNS